MAFYTHDGIRHESKEDALSYMEDMFLTDAPPSKDKTIQDIHKHDWGRFDIQASPLDEDEDNLSVMITETLTHAGQFAGTNMLVFADASAPKEEEQRVELIGFLEKEAKFMSMLSNELRESLVSVIGADGYFYDNESPEIVVEYRIDKMSEVVEKTVFYKIDDMVSGQITIQDFKDNVDVVIHDALNHFVDEIEGEFKPNTGRVGSNKLDYILDSALRTGRSMRVSLLPVSESRA